MQVSIQTKHLQVRNFNENDWPYLFEYTKLPQVMRYITSGTQTIGEAMKFVHQNIEGKPKAFAIVLQETNLLIGHITFNPYNGEHTYELGWIIHPEFQNRGYATEAVKAFMLHVFRYLKTHRLIAICPVENIASWRVMEKIGMRKEAHYRKSLPYGEHDWLDEYMYAILRADLQDKLQFPYKATFKS